MLRKTVVVGAAFALTVCALGAQDMGLEPVGTSFNPVTVIQVRKQVMQSFPASVAAIQAAARAGNMDEARTIAANVATLAALLPLLFAETHSASYAELESRYSFKGGDPLVFLTRARALQDVAIAAAEAEDASQITTAAFFQTCGACHGQFRQQ